MSEDYDYTPASHWQGHDFGAARQKYDQHVGRSYSDAKTQRKTNKDLIPDSISTDSAMALLFMLDHTGSMGNWTKVIKSTIYSKMPYLEHEAQEYFGKDVVMSLSFCGDAYSDDYPWQVRDFAKGADLKVKLEELIHEGNGGGQEKETYELGCLYYSRKAHMPNVIRKPILIIAGDEAPYDFVNEHQAEELLGIKLKGRLSTKKLFEELKEKYAVYVIRKLYNQTRGDELSYSDKQIYKTWASLVGEDHIATLPEAERIVDVIFGIFAQETDRIDYFKTEIEQRQNDDIRKVDATYKALRTIHVLPSDAQKKKTKKLGQSVNPDLKDGQKAKRLIER